MEDHDAKRHPGPWQVMRVDSEFAGLLVAVGFLVLGLVSMPMQRVLSDAMTFSRLIFCFRGSTREIVSLRNRSRAIRFRNEVQQSNGAMDLKVFTGRRH